jgi:hypothetical protein
MATVRVILRQSDDHAQSRVEEFQDVKARVVHGVLQIYRPHGPSAHAEEIMAEFQDAVYLYWRYFD